MAALETMWVPACTTVVLTLEPDCSAPGRLVEYTDYRVHPLERAILKSEAGPKNLHF